MKVDTRLLLVVVALTIGWGVTIARSQLCSRGDIGLLIDSSGSIQGREDHYQTLKNFIIELINRLDIGPERVRLGAAQFSGEAQTEFFLNEFSTREGLKKAVQDMQFLGSKTDIASGLRELRETVFNYDNGDRPHVPNIGIVFTDGKSNAHPDDTLTEAKLTRESGVELVSVGVTDEVNQEELLGIADSKDRVILVQDYDSLTHYLNIVLNVSCPTQSPSACPLRADIVFVLDASSSIVWNDEANWNPRLLGFAKSVVDSFPIGETKTRVGVVSFSDAAKINFHLNDYYDIGVLLYQINQVQHLGGETNLAAALRRMREEMFTVAHGDRPDVINIAIIITDGTSNVANEDPVKEARLAREAGVNVYAIGVTQAINAEELHRIASSPTKDHVFKVSDYAQLHTVLTEFIEKACLNIPNITTSTQSPSTPSPVTTTIKPSTTANVETTAEKETTTVSTTSSSTTVSSTTTMSETTAAITTSPETSPSTKKPTPFTGTIPTPTTPSPDDKVCIGFSDVVFLLDASGSIEKSNFAKILDFVSRLVGELRVNNRQSRVGVLTFSDAPSVQFKLNTYDGDLASMRSRIASISYTRGTTNTHLALEALLTEMYGDETRGDRPNARNVAILITDGESNNSSLTLQVADRVRKAQIVLVTVGIGDWIDWFELEAMASFPAHRNMFHVNDFNALSTLEKQLANVSCNNPTNECLSNPCQNNGECVGQFQYYYCKCPVGFAGYNCEDKCSGAADLIFAIDASGSIGRINFNLVIGFVQNAVHGLDVDSGRDSNRGVRVGLVTFGDDVKLEFDLGDYLGKLALLQAFKVRYTAGTTNTAAALRYIRENMFRSERGARVGVPRYIVVITDGRSDDRQSTWQEAMKARHDGIWILSLGVGDGINQKELGAMASDPISKNVLQANDFQSLHTSLARRISQTICHNIDLCDKKPCDHGATCTPLPGGFHCSPCPIGYTGKLCERACVGKAEIIFVLDNSGSIRAERFPAVLKFVTDVVANLDVHPDGARVALVTFADDATLQFSLDSYNNQQDVSQAVRYTPFRGGRTNTASALTLLRTQTLLQSSSSHRDSVPKFAIFVTDGNSNINTQKTIAEAIKVHTAGIHVIAVPVGRSFINMDELQALASEPKQANVIGIDRISQLPSIISNITEAMCDDVNECLSNPCRNTGTCRDELKRYVCDCDSSYTGVNCERRCTNSLDLVFVLDLSGSVRLVYDMGIRFAQRVVHGLNMRFNRARVGAVTYATEAQVQFYMDEYQSREAVINALAFHHHGGRTNAQHALKLARTEVFTQARGARTGIRDVVVVFSDGNSNVEDWKTATEAKLVREQGIDIYAIALGTQPNMREMNDIASDPDSEFLLRLRTIDEVDDVADSLLDLLCQ